MRVKSRSMASIIVITLCAAITSHAATSDGVSSTTQKAAVPVTSEPPSEPSAKLPTATVPATKEAKLASAPVSVLERFRTYSGQRTPAALSELFSKPVWAGVRQQPEIVLSNGATAVSIATAIPVKDNVAPNFAFSSAHLLSSAQINKDEWLIVAQPETGVMKAEMIVLTNGVTIEIPLIVAPPLPEETDLSEKGFIAFLGGTTADAKPVHDLNGDGRRDYIDDYIFTANYLVSKLSPVTERKNNSSTDPLAIPTSSQPTPTPPIEQQIRDLKR